MKPGKDARENLVKERLRAELAFAVEYLNACLEAGQEEFLLALKEVIETLDASVTEVAQQAELHRVSLHRILSKKGNPTLGNIGAILRAAGLRLTVSRGDDAA